MTLRPPPRRYDYVTDGAEIYVRSFATIRAESELSAIPASAEKVAVRMIHASGQTDLARDLVIHSDLVPSARTALNAGAPILTDANMVASGVTRTRLPAGNDVVCLLADPRVPELAERWGTTRSAAAVSLWADRLEGSVVAIGNAPTALFHLLEMLDDGAPRPAAIVGVPVGSSAPRSRRRRCSTIRCRSPIWWCGGAAAGRRWRRPRSMHLPRRRNERHDARQVLRRGPRSR